MTDSLKMELIVDFPAERTTLVMKRLLPPLQQTPERSERSKNEASLLKDSERLSGLMRLMKPKMPHPTKIEVALTKRRTLLPTSFASSWETRMDTSAC